MLNARLSSTYFLSFCCKLKNNISNILKLYNVKLKSMVFLLATLFIYISCEKSTQEVQPELKSTNEILSFSLQKSKNNAYLDGDIVGTIVNEEILLTIPEKVPATKLIATFTHNGESVFIGNKPQVSGLSINDFSEQVVYTVEAEDTSKKNYVVNIEWLVEEKIHIPHLYINTEDNVPIISKDDYVKGTLRIVGGGKYDDFEGPTSIKGRGNTTWSMPKKPYRLKLDTKASILGLPAEKNWVLLQNYIDPSLMCNAVAMRTGQLLEMPFTHHIIPVDVTLNGEYIGSYTFTEHKEVTANRINVGEGGWLIELDTNFDEDFKFISKNYQLPVMISYPELDKITEAEAQPIFDEMKNDFNALEDLLFAESFPYNNYLDYFDANAFVKYLIVYMLTDNEEINHPKSTYIYKKKGGKYNMGPIWDFDWAFGYQGIGTHFVSPNRDLFWEGVEPGTLFFSRIIQDPAILDIFKTEWPKFRTQKYPILVEYIKEYVETIRESHAKDQVRWKQSTGSIDFYSTMLLDWLNHRVNYIDNLVGAI